jgi:aspartate aminotransferase
MEAGKTKYTPLTGDPELISAVRSRFALTHCEPDGLDVIVTNGAKQALHSAFTATLNPGDEVILLAPYWTSYVDMVRLEGGVVRECSCLWDASKGWRLDLAAVEKAVTARTRWILLNSPCNPSGAVFDRANLAGLADIMRRHPQLQLLSDDIYKTIAWPEKPPLFAALHPELRQRTLVVDGVSKAYAMTGWRVGWAVGPAPLIKAMAMVQSQTTSAPSSISQAAAIAALMGPQDDAMAMSAAFQARRDMVTARLNAIDGFECPTPDGAFYAFPRIQNAIRRLGIKDDTEFCDRLLDAGVALVPGSVFGAPGFIRLSFAASMQALAEACDRLEAACA